MSIITHLMMMQLKFPACAMLFYGSVFEYVTFDLIPTDDFYDKVFDFENKEPYSDEAASIGYPSRYLIFNSGSLTIFIFVTILSQALFWLLVKVIPSNSKVSKFLQKKR